MGQVIDRAIIFMADSDIYGEMSIASVALLHDMHPEFVSDAGISSIYYVSPSRQEPVAL